jgi:hypothetical protein
LKCDGTRAETRFHLSAKRTSPFKSAVTSVRSITGSRGVRISGSNAGYTMFRGSVKGTGYLLHSPASTSLPLPCVNVCHHISTGLYVCASLLAPDGAAASHFNSTGGFIALPWLAVVGVEPFRDVECVYQIETCCPSNGTDINTRDRFVFQLLIY